MTFRTSLFFLVFVSAFSVLWWSLTLPIQAAPPSEFEKTVIVGDLQQPTAFRFLPDGRILISEKEGAIKILENGVLSPDPVITLVVLDTDAADERGVLGIEPDPNFATNGYLYVAYTTAQNRDRVSRITISGDHASPNSEVVLLESNQDGNVFHHGGELRFGPDGKLYWAMGMNTFNPNSQLLNNVHGKIHRINPDGSIPADNPLVGNPNALPSIWAYGLRNPFRFDFLPSGKVITGDVGGSLWEEVNVIEKGGNYGWPLQEGMCSGCAYVNPIFVYPHSEPPNSTGSITATLFYTGDEFPQEYQNAFFYGDYSNGFIRYLILDENQESVLSDHGFDDDAGAVVQLSQGPDGNMYQLDFYPGVLSKIALSDGDRAPSALLTASPSAGLAPLPVEFSSAGSFDPDGHTLTYLWNFGDGQTSTEAHPHHTFTTNGTYTVSLTVNDGAKTDTKTTKIVVGNRIPTGTITSPSVDSHYDAGDTITFTGTATDPEDSNLPASAFTWTFRFHHGTHSHPFYQTVTGTKTGTFEIPRAVDNLSNTWYAITLTVTDSQGLQHSTTRSIYPNLVTFTVQSNVPGSQYMIDGVPHTGTYTEEAVVGVERALSAVTPQFVNGKQYRFQSWNTGKAASHTLTVPDDDVSYQVNYQERLLPPSPWKTKAVGPRTAGDAFYDNGTFTINASTDDIWDTYDGFYTVHQTLSGNGEIVARLTSQTAQEEWAKAGVMIKNKMDPFEDYALLGVTPDHGYVMQYNFTGETGQSHGAYTLPNAWVRLKREGNVVTGYTSPDGQNWAQVGQVTLQLDQNVEVGLFMTSHNSAVSSSTVFDNVKVYQGGALLPPWHSTNVGNPLTSGTAEYKDGVYTITGAGTEMWGTADQLHFVSQQLTGNGQIIARVPALQANDAWARSGLMVKTSTQAGASYALLGVTKGNGLVFQSNFNSSTSLGNYTLPNVWLKLVRTGNTVTGYTSTDGSIWNFSGTATLTSNPATVEVGMYVHSHQWNQLSTAKFDNVSVRQNPANTLPVNWHSLDIGNPSTVGQSSYVASGSGTYTLSGSSTDIWADADQLQYAYKTLNGDGEITAQVVSQTNTDGWAKAGVMMKSSTGFHTPYALLALTPSHGVAFQSGFNSSAEYPGSAGVWLRLRRVGNQISSFTSVDGQTWTARGTVTMTLPSDATLGLFINSHQYGQTGTAVFQNVTVTQ